MRGQEKANRKLNNKGFSFIELLVAITLMCVLCGLAAYSITVMRAGDTKKASKTVSGQLSSLRVNTLTMQANWQMEIVNKGGSHSVVVYKNGNEQERVQLGSRIKVIYQPKVGGAEITIPNDSKLIIKFVQGTGKVSGMYTTSASLDTVSDVSGTTPVDYSGYCTFKFTNKNDGGLEDFKLYYETGTIVQD